MKRKPKYVGSKEYWQAEAKSWERAAETWKDAHLKLIHAITRNSRKKLKKKDGAK